MQELDLIKVTLIGGPADGEKMMTPSTNTIIRYTKLGESYEYSRPFDFDDPDGTSTDFYYEGPLDG